MSIKDCRWLVVNFVCDNTVDFVPKSWYQHENKVLFPSNPKQVSKLRIKRSEPDDSWGQFEVVILGEYDSYEKAKKKSKKAETYDDLDTSTNEAVVTKRKRPPNKKYASSTSDDSESDGCDPPQKKICNIVNLAKRPSISSRESSSTRSSITTPKRNSIQSRMSVCSGLSDTTIIENTQTNVRSSDEEFRRQVLKHFFLIRSILNEHTATLNAIMERHIESQAEVENVDENIMKLLPVANQESLDKLEEYLQFKQHFASFVKEIALIGGSSFESMTKQLMYKIVTNNVGVMYTWEGTKDKKKFKDLSTSKAIFAAIRCNKKLGVVDDHTIIKCIKKWLLRSKERLNYLKKDKISDG